MRERRIAFGGFLLAALLALATACSEGQPAVDRVQPNVVEKTAFDGEWYFLQTVIDTPYSAGYTFVGEQGDLERMHKESHQYIDVMALFKPVTKWQAQIARASIIPEAVRKAFKVAQTEKPGATHLELPEDVAATPVEDLYGTLLSHWQFAQRREPGKPKIRVLNPVAGEHGWSSRHTVIEIVNDDMPFLVDSVSMEVNRQGLTLHLIVHPIFAVERDGNGVLRGLFPR